MPTPFVPRPAQQRILEYGAGPMGISAVPGSGKTFTLSLLAERLVRRMAGEGRLDDREVLVVTFTNSAVENFRARIAGFLRQDNLLPGVGYRVRTLHGLAHDIVRERPSLVGLSEDFDIVDERTADDIKRDAVLAYLRSHPDAFSPFIQPDYLHNFRRVERYVQDDAIDIANAVIRTAKEESAEPHQLLANLRQQSGTWPLLEFGLQIYADYERSLRIRGAVDFDDLIVLALRALEAAPDYLTRLQERWPYILEDEAQDSSLLQERMLRTLTAAHGNWVRVGDPNQAINTTFTSANTHFLRKFMADHPEQARDLPNSGRSALPIITLANHLSEWSRTEHPILPRALALAPPHIEPTPPGDPQPNPEPGNPPVYFHNVALSPQKETEVVLSSLARWLPQHQEETVAILVPENSRGFHMTAALEGAGLSFDDSLLRSDSVTRASAQALSTVMSYLARPHLPSYLESVWTDVWWPRKGAQHAQESISESHAPMGETVRPAPGAIRKADLPEPVRQFGEALRRMDKPETFLFPGEQDWLDGLTWIDEVEGFRPYALAFRAEVQRWTRATILPVNELLLTLGNDLFTELSDLALTHHLAVLLAKLGRENPTWRILELAGELDNIAQNKRRILGFSEEAAGFEPKPGQVTVATMHAAKGLEWDRVYLLAVNNYSFPSGSAEDKYRGERWYARDNLNLVAEAIAQVEQLRMGTLDDYTRGAATQQARLDIAAERLRLFYVGITRARRELIVTYNTGRNPERDPNGPALAFEALQSSTQSKD